MAQISNTYSGKIVCLDKANVDTDQIIPKQFLKSIKKTGLGPFLFDSWRYEDEGYLGKEASKRKLKNDFILNNKAFSDANILKNGILAIQISKSNLDKIFSKQSVTKPLEISVDLVNQKIFYEKLFEENFEIDPYRKKCLIEGLDEIGYSLKYENEINKYEQKLRKERSWVINE